MDLDAVRIDQRRDGHAVAEVDPDVCIAAPDDQVARLADDLVGLAACLEVVEVALNRAALAADAVEEGVLLEGEEDETRAVEPIGTVGREEISIADLCGRGCDDAL
jgi:hypothetical protein